MLTQVTATRYVTALREGGSLPGLMEADDLGTYVVKFHGAGQGAKALVAEVIGTTLARGLGFHVPDLVTVMVDPAMAPGEPDQEIQDLLRASGGLNLGVDYLPGSLDYDPAAFPTDPALAGRVLWFDALVQNADRSWQNPNLLFWHSRLWLIDHGATLPFQHRWSSAAASRDRAYDAREHALVQVGPDVSTADRELAPLVTAELLQAAVSEVPDGWLLPEAGFAGPEDFRQGFVNQLRARLDARERWVPELVGSAARRGRDRGATPGRVSRRPAWLSGPEAVTP